MGTASSDDIRATFDTKAILGVRPAEKLCAPVQGAFCVLVCGLLVRFEDVRLGL